MKFGDYHWVTWLNSFHELIVTGYRKLWQRTDILQTGGRPAIDKDVIHVPRLPRMGRVGREGQLLRFLMLKPSVANTQIMIPAKLIELEVIIIFVRILLSIGNAVGSDDMGATCSPFAGTRVCVHEYDLSIHLIVVQ